MTRGLVWVQLGLPDHSTTITLVEWYKNMPAGSMQGLILETEDIEQEILELQKKGIEIAAIDETAWGKFATVMDPDGNGLLLHQNKF